MKDKSLREEIERPNKKEEELFTYEWIDGVRNSQVCFDVNPGGIIQILKSTAKAKNHYLLQGLEEKKLLLTVDMQ